MPGLTTTLLLIGLGAAVGGSALKPNKGRTVGESTRSRGTAEITGTAVPRGSLAAPLPAPKPSSPTAPPSALAAASRATGSALEAAAKQRKRAAAGGSVLSGAYAGKTGPRAVLQPKMLIGS